MNDTKEVSTPGIIPILLESRLMFEFITSLILRPYTDYQIGDGHPVIVFPGYGYGDFSTIYLRSLLKSLGYQVIPWGLGINKGPEPGVVEKCIQLINTTYQQTGRKVSLVGHSLGGVFARELSKLCPDETRLVITLGTPFSDITECTKATALFNLVSKESGRHEQYYPHNTPPVPTTSVYSKTDGVVPWVSSQEKESSQSENIEIFSSHLGMVLNISALKIVTDRLAQLENAWSKYEKNPSILEKLFLGQGIWC